MYKYLGLLTKWKDVPSTTEARRELGTLLLRPSANSDNLDDYAQYLGNVIDIACELLPKTDCAAQVRRLAIWENPKLREEACGLLKGELEQIASHQRTPSARNDDSERPGADPFEKLSSWAQNGVSGKVDYLGQTPPNGTCPKIPISRPHLNLEGE